MIYRHIELLSQDQAIPRNKSITQNGSRRNFYGLRGTGEEETINDEFQMLRQTPMGSEKKKAQLGSQNATTARKQKNC